ncbi:hypothetical protein EYR40_003932 [Pleurotus pulmonarius]|nr:hypothetical protein EYR40_003932 [Pleurotus pulmonarius]KAF4606639.1 hypothetical protein EYR38_000693 [Pleurotus pulmonarius]
MRARRVCLLGSAFFSLASAFSFTDSPSTQCGDLNVQWTGGTAPFTLMLIPIFGTARNVSIPAAAFSNGAGTFKTQLPFEATKQYVLTMSDATGFGTGGYSPLRTVGAAAGGATCNTVDPGVAFNFELNLALQQCRPYTFSGYDRAIQPVTAIGIVPGGTAVILRPQAGLTSFDWTASVRSGTSMIFMMIDAAGRQGGASDVKLVGITDDATCLNANSPASTTTTATSTSSSVASTPATRKPASATKTSAAPTATTSAASAPAEGGFSIAAIAGTVIGALIFLAVAVTLGLFLLRRSRFASGGPGRRQSQRLQSQIDLTDANPTYHPYRDNHTPGSSPFLPSDAQYAPTPYTLSQPQQSQPHLYGSQADIPHSFGHQSQAGYVPSPPNPYTQPPYQPPYTDYSQPGTPDIYRQPVPGVVPGAGGAVGVAGVAAGAAIYGHRPGLPSLSLTEGTSAEQSSRQSMASTTPTAAQRKAAMAGESNYKPPSRFILHTDIEDDLPPPNDDGVVELPPQYTERRMPVTDPLQAAPSSPPPANPPSAPRTYPPS